MKDRPIVMCIYGEGENCSFEDCPMFKKCWPEAYKEYMENKK